MVDQGEYRREEGEVGKVDQGEYRREEGEIGNGGSG